MNKFFQRCLQKERFVSLNVERNSSSSNSRARRQRPEVFHGCSNADPIQVPRSTGFRSRENDALHGSASGSGSCNDVVPSTWEAAWNREDKLLLVRIWNITAHPRAEAEPPFIMKSARLADMRGHHAEWDGALVGI